MLAALLANLPGAIPSPRVMYGTTREEDRYLAELVEEEIVEEVAVSDPVEPETTTDPVPLATPTGPSVNPERNMFMTLAEAKTIADAVYRRGDTVLSEQEEEALLMIAIARLL